MEDEKFSTPDHAACNQGVRHSERAAVQAMFLEHEIIHRQYSDEDCLICKFNTGEYHREGY